MANQVGKFVAVRGVRWPSESGVADVVMYMAKSVLADEVRVQAVITIWTTEAVLTFTRPEWRAFCVEAERNQHNDWGAYCDIDMLDDWLLEQISSWSEPTAPQYVSGYYV